MRKLALLIIAFACAAQAGPRRPAPTFYDWRLETLFDSLVKRLHFLMAPLQQVSPNGIMTVDPRNYSGWALNSDVTTALNSAITAAEAMSPPGIVQMPCGTFNWGTNVGTAVSVSITSAVALVGTSRTCTVIHANSTNTAGILLNIATGGALYMGHFSIDVTGNATFSANGTDIQWEQTAAAADTFEDFEVHGGKYGVYSDQYGLGNAFVKNGWFYNMATDAIRINPIFGVGGGNAETNLRDLNFIGNSPSSNSAINIQKTAITDTGGFYVSNILVDSNNTYGVIYQYPLASTCNGPGTAQGTGSLPCHCTINTGSLCAAGYLHIDNSTIVGGGGPAVQIVNTTNNYISTSWLQTTGATQPAVVLDSTLVTTILANHSISPQGDGCAIQLNNSPGKIYASNNMYGFACSAAGMGCPSVSTMVCKDSSSLSAYIEFIGEHFQQGPGPNLQNSTSAFGAAYFSLSNLSFTYSQLPSTAAVGSTLYCSNCTIAACSTAGTGAIVHYATTGQVCAAY